MNVMAMNGRPYWVDDPDFPREKHKLELERVFQGKDDYAGSCLCGANMGIGANYTILENFDYHAEQAQNCSPSANCSP